METQYLAALRAAFDGNPRTCRNGNTRAIFAVQCRTPKLICNPAIQNLDDFKMSDFEIVGYHPQEAIKAPLL